MITLTTAVTACPITTTTHHVVHLRDVVAASEVAGVTRVRLRQWHPKDVASARFLELHLAAMVLLDVCSARRQGEGGEGGAVAGA